MMQTLSSSIYYNSGGNAKPTVGSKPRPEYHTFILSVTTLKERNASMKA
jgi:hypothetical protein